MISWEDAQELSPNEFAKQMILVLGGDANYRTLAAMIYRSYSSIQTWCAPITQQPLPLNERHHLWLAVKFSNMERKFQQLDFEGFLEKTRVLLSNPKTHICVDTTVADRCGSVLAFDDLGNLTLENVQWTSVSESENHIYVNIDINSEDGLRKKYGCDTDELYHQLSIEALKDKEHLYFFYLLQTDSFID